MDLNYQIISISEKTRDAERGNECVYVDFVNRENGSIYRVFLETGMSMHIDFKYNPATHSTAGTAIYPLAEVKS